MIKHPKEKAVTMTMTRTRAAIVNFSAAFAGQIITVIVNFASRRIFLDLLGGEYTGLGSLYGHILSFLSLAEPGFAAAVIYAYYRPIAEGDTGKITALNTFLSRINLVSAAISLFAGLAVTPFLSRLADIPEGMTDAVKAYILSVINLSLGYVFSSRRAFAFANMRGYILTAYHTAFFTAMSFGRLCVLYFTKSYCMYLAATLVFGIAEDYALHVYLGGRYPFLKLSSRLSEMDMRSVTRQVQALFFHRLGGIIVGSCDNLAVMSAQGLAAGAYYGNYTMISGSLAAFTSLAAGSISSCIGNLGATESRERVRSVFMRVFAAVLVIASVSAPALYFAYPRVITAWVGEEYVLGRFETFLFCTSYFIVTLRSAFLVFRDALGLFRLEFAKPFLETAVNVSVTLVLAPRLGISGVLIGQIAGMLVCLVYEPCALFYALREKKPSANRRESPKAYGGHYHIAADGSDEACTDKSRFNRRHASA